MDPRAGRPRDLSAAKWSGLGGLAAAGAFALSWLCCLPLAAGASGVLLAVAAGIGWSLRPWLAGAAVLLVGFALYRVHRRPRCDADRCADPARRHRVRILVWTLALLVAVLVTLPWWSGHVLYRLP